MKSLIICVSALFAAVTASADSVNPQAMWFHGMNDTQGTYVFAAVSSPGGLAQVLTDSQGHETERAVAIEDTTPAFRDMIKGAQIVFHIEPASRAVTADQTASPGQRGQLPYFGHIRHYDETAHGTLSYQGLPGIGLDSGDSGNYSGTADFHLSSSMHSDPSDAGIYSERQYVEPAWGVAALSSMYADLSASDPAASTQNDDHVVMANARMLRNGMEIVSYIEWMDPNPPAGSVSKKYLGSVRLVRISN